MAVLQELVKTKLKKDDVVRVMAGKDRGKQGRVLKILRTKNRVLVEGVNIVKKTKRAKNQQDRGGIIEIEAPLHASNVQPVCKKCGPTRLRFEGEGRDKKRVCRKCGEAL